MDTKLLFSALALACSVNAQPYVYPAKGQSPEQQNRDEFACHQWAVKETGYDPLTQVSAQDDKEVTDAPSSTQPAAGVGKSALRGATKGAVIAELSDGDAGKGAAAGATLGMNKARRQQRKQQAMHDQKAAEAERAQAEAEAEILALQQNYGRASVACLEGRGYTIK